MTIDNGHEKLHRYAYFVPEKGMLKLAAVRPAGRKADDGVAAPAQGR